MPTLDSSRLHPTGMLATDHEVTAESTAVELAARKWALTGSASRLATEKDDTFVIDAGTGGRYVFKVSNSSESAAEIDFQCALMTHVADSAVGELLPRLVVSVDGQMLVTVDGADGQRLARVMTFMEGTPLDRCDSSASQRKRIGEVSATLRHATRSFVHPADRRLLPWNVVTLPALEPLLDVIEDAVQRDLLARGLTRFNEVVVPVLLSLRRQVVHNDFSKSNLLVDHGPPRFATGVLDCGGSVKAPIAVDVSTALPNQLPSDLPDHPQDNMFVAGFDLLRGYLLGLVERRTRLLGPAYRRFYEEPIRFVPGQRSRLWDVDRNEFLDVYNNVVSVGNARPAVVEAVHRQMATLCTHTRYLQEGILDYAEQLLATFGGAPGDRHLMMTCTGSEANDLATRIAKHRTGQGINVTAEAYHGNSDCTASYSPSLGDNPSLGTWVPTVPAPDSYRIDAADFPDFFEHHVREAMADLHRHGQGVSAPIVDSLFSSVGVYAHPTSLLGGAVDAVHEAGGLFVADEVQTGFARSGESMWGYQRHGFAPGIITMGKPMGNGYPVADVVVDHDVVAKFGRKLLFQHRWRKFRRCRASDAERHRGRAPPSQRPSRRNRLASRTGELEKRHHCIRDVRGAGSQIGVQIVSDRDRTTPDRRLAAQIVNDLRDRRVLISATGPAGNVLKIRPPLVLNGDDAARLRETLDETRAAAPGVADIRIGCSAR